MRAKVLVIEDEREIGELICTYLEYEGIDVILVETAEKGLKELQKASYDLIVLDINLPGMDGFEFLQSIRKEINIPVIIVSARDSDEDMVLGLGVGADDFVTKPFSPKVLVARVRAHLRRFFDSKSIRKKQISFGPFTLDMDGSFLEKNGNRIPLTPKEFELLCFLINNPGIAMSPEKLYKEVWGHQYGDIATVAIHIQRLRRKIEEDPANPCYIETIHGFGYRFNPKFLEEKK